MNSRLFKRHEARCSFCNKSQREVHKLVAGPSVYICDECVAICNDVVVGKADEGVCLVCRHGHAKADCVLVPDRGPVCRKCVDRIREAAAT